MSKLKLGDKAVHVVTGFEGIVVARVEYLTGCAQVGLQPQGIKDGKPYDSMYFDEPYVDLVEASVVRNRTPRRVEGASRAPGASGNAPPPGQ